MQLVPATVLAFALLLTLGSGTLLFLQARKADQARFRNVVQTTSDRIERRLDAYVALLQGAGGLFAASREVTHDEFAAYVTRLELARLYPGIRGVGFTLRFDPSERAELERRVREARGLPDFRVTPDTPRDEWHAIVMLEPRDERNLAAMGYDMYTEPVRREAMARARDTGRPALSGKVTLKQEIDAAKQPGFLLYVPVYRGVQTPATVEERRERLLGFVYSPFRANDLLTGIFGTEGEPRAAFQLYDGPRPLPENLLYSSHDPGALPRSPMLRTAATLEVAGRPWALSFESLPAFDDTASGREVVPFVMLGLLASLVLFWTVRARVLALQVAERTALELREALAQRAHVEAQLREEDRRKDEFLAMLAHELRNPLAPILTAVELMRRKARPAAEPSRERDIIERQAHQLRRLVDDLLDVSRVTQGKIQLRKVALELAPAARHALETVRPEADARGHHLHAELPAEALRAPADPVRFEQILVNLLRNAIKYSERGARITLSLAQEQGEAVVRVADTGVGISAEDLPHLFKPFTQVNSTLDRAQGGLGLGLTLVQSLTQLHGGRVEAFSEGPGKGSTFTVRLPLLPPDARGDEPRASEAPAPGASRRRRALVADDNVDAAELVAEVLALEGHEVAVVHDGPAVLERVRTFAPDVVFLDIGLPGLDGYEVARRLRARPELDRVPIVALTGYGQPSDRRRSAEAGFDAHLVKPVDLRALKALAAGQSPRGVAGHGLPDAGAAP